MEASLRTFAERAGIAVRYGSSWRSTRQDGDRLVLATDDGEYRCRAAVLAIGMTEPWVPGIPGLELAHHYVNVETVPTGIATAAWSSSGSATPRSRSARASSGRASAS